MRIVDHCRRVGVQFRLVPDLYEMSLGRLDIDTVSGIPLMGMKEARSAGQLLPQATDRRASRWPAGRCSAWLFVLLALLIRLEIGRLAILRTGARWTRRASFTCWKFRSMRPGAEQRLRAVAGLNEAEGPIFKMRDDPRRTRLGAFIRRWSLDELPQLWNVLLRRHEPRRAAAATPREVAHYEDWQRQRLETLPGLHRPLAGERSQRARLRRAGADGHHVHRELVARAGPADLLRTVPAVLSGKGAF